MTQVAAAPRHRWHIGRYRIEHDRDPRGCGSWSISDGCDGATARTLLGAWRAFRHWKRTPSRPCE